MFMCLFACRKVPSAAAEGDEACPVGHGCLHDGLHVVVLVRVAHVFRGDDADARSSQKN